MKNIYLVFLIAFSFLLTSCHREKEHYQGYVDAELRYISANFPGTLKSLYVERGDQVNEGQKLFSLEKNPQADSYEEAKQRVAIAESELDRATKQLNFNKDKLNRRLSLKSKEFANQEEVDAAQNSYDNAFSQFLEAKNNLIVATTVQNRLEWNLNKKEVSSEITGMVFDTYYKPGELILPGKPVLSLLAPEDVKIIFYIPETDMNKLKVKQKVSVTCDGCEPITAYISYISPKAEYTPPVNYSEQLRSKLIFMIEARADKETNKKLNLGIPVSVAPQ